MNQDKVIFIRENRSVEGGYSDAWYNKAAALNKLGRYEEVLQVYDKALELNPDDYKAWYDKTFALGNLGRYEEALQVYDKVLELSPVDYRAWCDTGIALALGKLGRYEEAADGL